jgi:hypothetical protein
MPEWKSRGFLICRMQVTFPLYSVPCVVELQAIQLAQGLGYQSLNGHIHSKNGKHDSSGPEINLQSIAKKQEKSIQATPPASMLHGTRFCN